MCVRSLGLPAVVGLTDIASHPLRDGVSLLACRSRRFLCLVRSVGIVVSSVAGLSHRRAAARFALRLIVGRLLAPLRRGSGRLDYIIWRGRAWLSCGDGKKTGAGLFPVPLLARLLFLASANYAPVSPDFVIALGGLTEAGLTVLVRVELDGNSGLVLVSLLLVRLAALEKHCQSFHRAGLLFSLPLFAKSIIRPRCRRPCLFPYIWRRKHNRRSSVLAACPFVLSCPWSVSPLDSFFAPSLGPSCLLASYAHAVLIGSSAPTGSAACLIRSLLLVGSSARPCLVSPGSPSHRQAGRGGAIGGRRFIGGRRLLACLGWRRAAGGHRRRLAAGGGRGRGCLLASGRWTERLDHSSIVSLFSSSAHPIDEVPAHPHHLIISSTGEESSFPFRPTPSRLLFSACLLGVVPPSPAGGCVGCGMACGGGRADCLLAFSCPVPLFRCRSFARCICPTSLVPLVPSWGVVGRFMGFSDRYLVGVGVSQNMPLNRILWLLVGIFGDVVRCHFSALLVASFSLVCPALRPLSAAASWCRGGHVCAVSW